MERNSQQVQFNFVIEVLVLMIVSQKDVHWGLDIGSTDTEAVPVSVQEGGLGIRIVQIKFVR